MFLKGDNKGAETHKNVCVYVCGNRIL